jgi:hypothetical protein
VGLYRDSSEILCTFELGVRAVSIGSIELLRNCSTASPEMSPQASGRLYRLSLTGEVSEG